MIFYEIKICALFVAPKTNQKIEQYALKLNDFVKQQAKLTWGKYHAKAWQLKLHSPTTIFSFAAVSSFVHMTH